jgi:hypothetical protein
MNGRFSSHSSAEYERAGGEAIEVESPGAKSMMKSYDRCDLIRANWT